MTINVLRGRGAARKPTPGPLPIGDEGSEIFSCPACARPLAIGARRCPGCRAWLVLGVQARHAAVFVAAGVGLGVLISAAVVAFSLAVAPPAETGVANTVPLPAATAGADTAPMGSAASLPTSAPAVPGIPAAAVSALTRTAQMNARLAANISTLQDALAERSLDTLAVAQVLRSMTADAAYAAGAADRVGGWDDAAAVSAGLADFYADVRATAREGLAKSLASEQAYRTAATRMLGVLAGLVPLDAASRELAAAAGVELPAVDLSDLGLAEVPGASTGALAP